MHGTAFAFAVPGLFSKELCHHPIDLRPFSNNITMTSMGADYIVIGNVLEKTDDKDIVKRFAEAVS